MDEHDAKLRQRLEALEASAPGNSIPPNLKGDRRRGVAWSVTLGPALAIVLSATAMAGAIVIANAVRGYPGVQDAGQPLAGSHMECMTPPEAQAFLTAHGFAAVVWQVESGSPADGTNRSVEQVAAPAHGFVIPGSILGDGRLHMVIDQRTGATGVGDCVDGPMP